MRDTTLRKPKPQTERWKKPKKRSQTKIKTKFAPTQTPQTPLHITTPPFVQTHTHLHPATPPQPQHCHTITTLEPINQSTCLEFTSLPAKEDRGSTPQTRPEVTSNLKCTRSLTALRHFPTITTEQGLDLMALGKNNDRELQFEDQLQLEA